MSETEKLEIKTLKELGNEEYIKKNFMKAKEYYTKAIQSETDQIVLSILYGNRSSSNTQMQDYALALFDALRSVANNYKYEKGWNKLIELQLKTKLYENALNSFEIITKIFNDEKYLEGYENTKILYESQKKKKIKHEVLNNNGANVDTEKYDNIILVKGLNRFREYSFDEEFLKNLTKNENVEIRDSDHGKGLFAKKSFKFGKIIHNLR
jgi:tetratricopeptide (TPR) repeat protein